MGGRRVGRGGEEDVRVDVSEAEEAERLVEVGGGRRGRMGGGWSATSLRRQGFGAGFEREGGVDCEGWESAGSKGIAAPG